MNDKIKIGLIDSGITRSYLESCDIVDVCREEFPSPEDEIFHGTVCAYLINKITPGCQINNLKVLGKGMYTSSKRLIQSMMWCIENDMDIINLSISLPDMDYYHEFKEVCDKAHKKGCLVVASANNAGRPSLPSYLDGVCGVAVGLVDKDAYLFNEHAQIQYYANGENPLVLQGESRSHASFATARLTAFLAKALQKDRAPESALSLLNNASQPYRENLVPIPPVCYRFQCNLKMPELDWGEIIQDLKGQRTSFIGTPKECELLRTRQTEIEFEHIIAVRESYPGMESLVDEKKNYRDCLRKSGETFLIGFVSPALLKDIILANDRRNRCISIYPVETEFTDEVEYAFPGEDVLEMELDALSNDYIFQDRKPGHMLLNLTYLDLLPMELLIQDILGDKNSNVTLLSNNPLSVFLGIDFLIKDKISLENQRKYVKSVKEIKNLSNSDSIWLSARSPYMNINKNAFEHSFVSFTGLLLSFYPDRIYIIIDKYTPTDLIEKNIRYIKSVIQSKIEAILYLDFDTFFNLSYTETSPGILDSAKVNSIQEMIRGNQWEAIQILDYKGFGRLLRDS